MGRPGRMARSTSCSELEHQRREQQEQEQHQQQQEQEQHQQRLKQGQHQEQCQRSQAEDADSPPPLRRFPSRKAPSRESGCFLKGNGWLDSARGCLHSAAGTRTWDHPGNQDAMVLWEGVAGEPSSVLCALMDGHGPHGALVAQAVQASLPHLVSRKLLTSSSSMEDLHGHSPCSPDTDNSDSSDADGTSNSDTISVSWCGSPESMSPSGSFIQRTSSSDMAPPELCLGDPHLLPLASPVTDGESSEQGCVLGSEAKAGFELLARSSTACSRSNSDDTLCSISEELSEGDMPLLPSEGDEGLLLPSSGSVKHLDDLLVSQRVLEESFAEINEDIRHNPKIYPLFSGSTVVLALLLGRQLTVAHVGDSRCVLAMEGAHGALEAVPLTVDHTPCEAAERRRIQAEGGRVLALREEPEVARVWLPHESAPGLALTRAIGDELLKDYGVVCTPEVLRITLDDSARFIVLGSEGLWSVLSNAEAVRVVGSCSDRVQAAERLVSTAQKLWLKTHGLGAVSDISAMVYFLRPLEMNLEEKSSPADGHAW